VSRSVALAIGAHPDDIEFMMGGTLILLKEVGYTTHLLNLASGSCGSTTLPSAKIRSIRRREARAAAQVLGAVVHPSLVDDLEIYYERRILARLAAVIREVNPSVLLVPSPQDYMEDHTNACRLAVSAAFVRGMRNFVTVPRRSPVLSEVTVYHAMPHGLRDPLRRRVIPGAFVNTGRVIQQKTRALAQHESQQAWLDASQKMNRYLKTLRDFSMTVGRMSRRFRHAEGWRRHLHYGFCKETADPLRDVLGKDYLINHRFERALERGG
jgi:LmbE family N-acetylglucosaminyl deacetylase